MVSDRIIFRIKGVLLLLNNEIHESRKFIQVTNSRKVTQYKKGDTFDMQLLEGQKDLTSNSNIEEKKFAELDCLQRLLKFIDELE